MDQGLAVVGAVLILAAYAAVQLRRIDARDVTFSLVNAIGSGLLAYVAVVEAQLGFFLLEGVWFVVSAGGVVRALVRPAS